MASEPPKGRGPRSASVGHGNRGTMLRYLPALLACLERAAGPARPTAALPQISSMEPITTPFSRPRRRSLEPGRPAQRSAATQLGRRSGEFTASFGGCRKDSSFRGIRQSASSEAFNEYAIFEIQDEPRFGTHHDLQLGYQLAGTVGT